jgi:hypothetical protein
MSSEDQKLADLVEAEKIVSPMALCSKCEKLRVFVYPALFLSAENRR